MCGIVGYIGQRDAIDFLIEGLRRLEYRGYDSAGVATTSGGRLQVTKSAGRIDALVEKLGRHPIAGNVGVGHTRWATHGPATDGNAHPHLGGDGAVAVVHNGVIENFRAIKERLQAEGYHFASATDTEVIAHLIASCLEKETAATDDEPADSMLGDSEHGDSTRGNKPAGPAAAGNGQVPVAFSEDNYEPLVRAVSTALAQLQGTYGLAVLFRDYPDVIIAARHGSPLVVGVGPGEHWIASDASPLAGHTDRIVYLADYELAVVTANRLRVIDREQQLVNHNVQVLDMVADDVQLDGYPHFMLKEIYEQPESIRNAMRGRLSLDEATAVFGGLNLTPGQLRSANRFVLTACGTSWHAAMVGEYLIEDLAQIPVEVEYASELRYRNPPMDNGTLLFAITQSGETADTLAALKEIKRKGYPTLAICNVVGSSIAQEADGGIYLHAGPEIGVASTKAFTSQCVTLAMLALYFGRLRNMSFDAGIRLIERLQELPDRVARALQTDAVVQRIAEKYYQAENFLYLGRQYNFPAALEGALKLKEISYIHAEGYPAAEMKHGPIALVDEHTPSVIIIPHGMVYDKVMANLEEIKARGGPVIAVVCEGDQRVADLADDVIEVPNVEDFLQPMVTIVPLQLLAYHIAVLRGCDVDKPRNLAKSVTVE
ncbi:MAG TPA: glutamine--fructose-6-phosphate transaminase (isomerizing) [Pirellulales bacterium]|jgi:glucosamine--fructose-6-phosphate aminotransferase (isomerizing)